MTMLRENRQRRLFALLVCLVMAQSVLAQVPDFLAIREGHNDPGGALAVPIKRSAGLVSERHMPGFSSEKTRSAAHIHFLVTAASSGHMPNRANGPVAAGQVRQPQFPLFCIPPGRAPPLLSVQ